MKKYILILLLILSSCGARKVNKSDTKITKDSIVEKLVEVVKEETKEEKDSTNLIVVIEDEETTVSPIDTTKEMVVNGKSYKNAVLKSKKKKTNSLYTNNKIATEIKRMDSIAAVKASTEEEIVASTKYIDKKQDYSFWVILIILIIILITAWQNRPRLL